MFPVLPQTSLPTGFLELPPLCSEALGVRLRSVTAFSISPEPAVFLLPYSRQVFWLWQPSSLPWGPGWGPDLRDPQFLNLVLFLARVRPEVFLVLIPVLQHCVLLATWAWRPDKWLTLTDWLRTLEIITLKRFDHCGFYWKALSWAWCHSQTPSSCSWEASVQAVALFPFL